MIFISVIMCTVINVYCYDVGDYDHFDQVSNQIFVNSKFVVFFFLFKGPH